MPKKQPPSHAPGIDDPLYEERTIILGRGDVPGLSGLMRGETTDLSFDEESFDLSDEDLESVSDAAFDDIVLTEEELIATGGFRLAKPREVAPSLKRSSRAPAPPAKSSTTKGLQTRTSTVAKAAPAKAKPVAKGSKSAVRSAKPASRPEPTAVKVSAGPIVSFEDNAWAIETERLLRAWAPDVKDIELVRAHQVNQRQAQRRLWESHTSRFGAKQDFSRAMSSAAVAEAVLRVPKDKLVAVELRVGTRYFLVWVDLDAKRMVAVLSDLKVS